MNVRWIIGISLASVAIACTEQPGAIPAVMTRDSAGVTIVTSARPAWASAHGWSLTDTPLVQIGAASGEPAYLFSHVRDAVRLPGGRIVVGDGASNQIRFFDSAGTFQRAVGRNGGGPGEFERLRAIRRCDDDLLTAFDLSWQRSHFTLDGAFVDRTTILLPGGRTPYALACTTGDRYLVTGWGDAFRTISQLYRTVAPLLVVEETGDVLARFDSVPGSERIGNEHGSRPHPFGRTTVVALRDDTVYIGTADTWEIRLFAMDGRLMRIARRAGADLTITSEMRQAYATWLLARTPAGVRPATQRQLDDMVYPSGMPAYTQLELDPAGNVWLRHFSPPGGTSEIWTVMAPGGRWLGDLTFPHDFAVSEIGDDYVLGVARDSLDVEYVRMYGLQK